MVLWRLSAIARPQSEPAACRIDLAEIRSFHSFHAGLHRARWRAPSPSRETGRVFPRRDEERVAAEYAVGSEPREVSATT
jgi:hypothetical protein